MPEIFPIGNFVLRAIAWASIRLARIRNKFSDPGERREGYRGHPGATLCGLTLQAAWSFAADQHKSG
jgi:hypothetical protein